MHRHILSLADMPRDQLSTLLHDAEGMRKRGHDTPLAGKVVILVFFNPSLRTRVSMELAAQALGARTVTLNVGQGMWRLETEEGVVMDSDRPEHLKDAAKVLSRYGDLLAVRAFPARRSWAEDAQEPVLTGLMRWADVPVLNLESSLYHPCQAFADLLTIRSFTVGDRPEKVVLKWCNHPKPLPTAVPNSFALAITRMGWDLTIARPEGYDLSPEIMARCHDFADAAGANLELTSDREAALKGARVIYAKSWGRIDRYGEEERELNERHQRNLERWIVDESAMLPTDGGRFMHCLPVRRNVVVSDGVLDSPASCVYDQAENRLHGQKALLRYMLNSSP